MKLIVGATGMVGSEICQRLASKGMPLRAMVRESSDPAKVERLMDLGAKIVTGNLCDPNSLKTACQGVCAMICTISCMPFCYKPGVNDIQPVDFEGVNNLIEAAKGKTFEVTYVPPEALQVQYGIASDPMLKSFIALTSCYAAGDPIEMSGIQKSFGFRLTPMKEHIEQVMATAGRGAARQPPAGYGSGFRMF